MKDSLPNGVTPNYVWHVIRSAIEQLELARKDARDLGMLTVEQALDRVTDDLQDTLNHWPVQYKTEPE